LALTLLGGDSDLIYSLSVEVVDFATSREFLKLLDGAYADHFFSIVRHPDRDGVTPESIAREAPVSGVS